MYLLAARSAAPAAPNAPPCEPSALGFVTVGFGTPAMAAAATSATIIMFAPEAEPVAAGRRPRRPPSGPGGRRSSADRDPAPTRRSRAAPDPRRPAPPASRGMPPRARAAGGR